MSGQVFSIALPPEGFIMRDFALTALAEIASETGGNLEIDARNATIQNVSSTAVIRSYSNLLQRAGPPVRLFQPDNRSRNKIFQEVKKLSGGSPANLHLALEAYGKWIATQTSNIMNIMNSLQQLRLWPGRGVVLKWGFNPDIPALQYFKLNVYAGQRSFLPPRYLNAEMKLDIHTTMLLLLGSSLSRAGTRQIGEDRVDIHLSYQDPGAKNIWSSLHQLVNRVGLQTEPLLLFRLVTAFSLTTPGLQPIALFEVSLKGNRPSILSYRHIELDKPVYTLFHSLNTKNRRRLADLLVFALQNWNKGRREIRLIAQATYDLTRAIFLTLTGAPLDGEGEFYRVTRYTCETTSEEFSMALEALKKEKKIDFTRDEFRDLLEDIITGVAQVRKS